MKNLMSVPVGRKITVAEASELSKQVGVRICWRPDDKISRITPELDTAEVLEG